MAKKKKIAFGRLDLMRNDELKGRSKIKIGFVKDRPGHDFRYALNSNKIKKKLGWNHIYSFDKALIKTMEWYLSEL